MSFYDIDWDKVVREGTPGELRKPKRLAWQRVLVWFVRNLYESFMTYRADRLYRLEHNSQVCKMEGALNDTFDPTHRRIYIDDGPFVDPTYLFLEIEDKEIYLATEGELPVVAYPAPVPLYTNAETGEVGYQFIVWYPAGLVFNMARMKALIDRDRLPSKNVYGIFVAP